MRLYTFTNYYLSSIQQGIQPAHLVGELFIKYPNDDDDMVVYETLHTWAKHHKTIICLNGGNSAQLDPTYKTLCYLANKMKLPVASFCEDLDSLGGIMTTCGIVVPEEIYAMKTSIDVLKMIASPTTEEQLYLLLAEHQLAK